MTNVDNLILDYLRVLRASQERMDFELCEIKTRITSLESCVSGICPDSSRFNDSIVQSQIGLDQFFVSLEEIEKRLELVG